MDLKRLQYFLAVADAGSISEAARLLHVSQPPLSRQLAILEEELNVVLFYRTNRGISLTEAGQLLARQGHQLLNRSQEIVSLVRDVNAGTGGCLRLGIIYSVLPIALPMIHKFHDLSPNVELYIRLGSPNDLLEDLNKGNLSVLFLRGSVDKHTGVHETLIGEDVLSLIMTAETDPAPELSAIPIRYLHERPMCFLRSDDVWGYHQALFAECQRNDVRPQTVCVCYDSPMLMQMVRSGFGIGFMPAPCTGFPFDDGVYAKPLQGFSVSSYSRLVWNELSVLSPCVQRFINTCRGQLPELPT